ncbi:coagulation factor XII-like isoform X2 [Anopheles albimanus]|nr:coagulation factor XII-like isoform X2 [Anopheles albimanus]
MEPTTTTSQRMPSTTTPTTTMEPTTTTSQRIPSTTSRTTTMKPTTRIHIPRIKPTRHEKLFSAIEIKRYESFVPKTCGNHTRQNGTFGWTVLIGTGHFYRRCVGTLINDGFVLTAAYCVYEMKPSNITLFFGTINVAELPKCVNENYGCQQARAEQLWIHEDFVPGRNAFNVALIKAALVVKHDSKPFIYPICLPLNTTEDDTDPAKRHILRPRIYDTSNQIQERCGYSGVPIVVIDSYKLYHVVGVANHPVDCDRKRVKRDATPAMEYVEWILQILTEGKKHVEPWAAENEKQQLKKH